jgi:hypothetical protein
MDSVQGAIERAVVTFIRMPLLTELRACLKKTTETLCGRFGVPPLGGSCAAPPKGGTPNRVFKQALSDTRLSPLTFFSPFLSLGP